MSTFRSLIRPAIFRLIRPGLSAARGLVTVLAVFSVTVAGFSAPAFAAPSLAQPAGAASTSLQAPAVAPAQWTASVQAGVFVPATGRVVDTTTGLGGISGAVAANTWHPFQMLGMAGVPTSGVDAVLVTLTVVNSTSANAALLEPNTARNHETTTLYSGVNDTVSNSAIIAVGTDGKLALYSTTSQQFFVDVQGYFTAGDTPAPGGFVSVAASRVIDTRVGIGYPAGDWTGTGIKSLTLKGKGGVPDTASAVFANITVISTDAAHPVLATLPGGGFYGGGGPGTTLNFRGNEITAVAAVLNMNAAGVVDISHTLSATGVQVVVDIQGYFDGRSPTVPSPLSSHGSMTPRRSTHRSRRAEGSRCRSPELEDCLQRRRTLPVLS